MKLLETNKIISTLNQPSDRNRNSEYDNEGSMTPMPTNNSKGDLALFKRHSSGESYEHDYKKDQASLKLLLNNEMLSLFPEELQIHSNAKERSDVVLSDRASSCD